MKNAIQWKLGLLAVSVVVLMSVIRGVAQTTPDPAIKGSHPEIPSGPVDLTVAVSITRSFITSGAPPMKCVVTITITNELSAVGTEGQQQIDGGSDTQNVEFYVQIPHPVVFVEDSLMARDTNCKTTTSGGPLSCVVAAIKAGARQKITFDVTAPNAAAYGGSGTTVVIQARVDPANRIPEKNETNNRGEATLEVVSRR